MTHAVVSETLSRQRPLLRGKRGSNAASIRARLSKTRATEAPKRDVMPCPQGTLLLHANDTMKTLPHPSPMNSLNTYVGKKMVQATCNPFLASATQMGKKKKKRKCQAGTEPGQAPTHKVHLDVIVAAGCLAAGCKCHRGFGAERQVERHRRGGPHGPVPIAAEAAAAELFFFIFYHMAVVL